jgi:hypothetical protein
MGRLRSVTTVVRVLFVVAVVAGVAGACSSSGDGPSVPPSSASPGALAPSAPATGSTVASPSASAKVASKALCSSMVKASPALDTALESNATLSKARLPQQMYFQLIDPTILQAGQAGCSVVFEPFTQTFKDTCGSFGSMTVTVTDSVTNRHGTGLGVTASTPEWARQVVGARYVVQLGIGSPVSSTAGAIQASSCATDRATAGQLLTALLKTYTPAPITN